MEIRRPAIVARLHDKYHSWNDFGLNTLIPHTLLQGLLGYAYCCPDMVGGGILDCFNKGQKMDEELFVRWAQANALMGMMQMSVSPWRVLNEENAPEWSMPETARFSGRHLLPAGAECRQTGEPITRHMAYAFPGQGFESVSTQFMLGDRLLAAPVLEKGATEKNGPTAGRPLERLERRDVPGRLHGDAAGHHGRYSSF